MFVHVFCRRIFGPHLFPLKLKNQRQEDVKNAEYAVSVCSTTDMTDLDDEDGSVSFPLELPNVGDIDEHTSMYTREEKDILLVDHFGSSPDMYHNEHFGVRLHVLKGCLRRG